MKMLEKAVVVQTETQPDRPEPSFHQLARARAKVFLRRALLHRPGCPGPDAGWPVGLKGLGAEALPPHPEKSPWLTIPWGASTISGDPSGDAWTLVVGEWLVRGAWGTGSCPAPRCQAARVCLASSGEHRLAGRFPSL